MTNLPDANLFSRLFADRTNDARIAVETDDGRTISFGELRDLTAQCANHLVARGITVGDRVAAQIEKSVEGLVLYLATLRVGAVFLPLNTGYTLPELEYFFGDAEPRLIVCDPVTVEGITNIAWTRHPQ